MGSTAPARRWVVPRSRARGQESTSISLVNTNVPPAHVDVQVVSDGTIDRPAALQDLAIPSECARLAAFGPGRDLASQ